MPPRSHFEGTIQHRAEIFIETLNASDRVAAISCAALLDDTIGAALAARFVEIGKDWEDRIFTDQLAPLADLHAKIVIGYAMGLFGPMTRADLNIIRSVRNDFAHSAAPVTFDEPEIADKCKRLTGHRIQMLPVDTPKFVVEFHNKPKTRYIATSQWIALKLIPKRPKRRPVPPSFLP